MLDKHNKCIRALARNIYINMKVMFSVLTISKKLYSKANCKQFVKDRHFSLTSL